MCKIDLASKMLTVIQIENEIRTEFLGSEMAKSPFMVTTVKVNSICLYYTSNYRISTNRLGWLKRQF